MFANKANNNIFGGAQTNTPFNQPHNNNVFSNNNTTNQGNIFGNRNVVGNNAPANNTTTNNIFGQTNQQNNSPFVQNNQGNNNAFTGNNNANTGAGIFGQNNNQPNTMFGQNNNNQGNTQPQNNNNGIFGQNNNTGGNNMFNARPTGTGIFGNNPQVGQNNTNTSIFGQNNTNMPNNQPNQLFNQPNNTFPPMIGAGNNPQPFLQQNVPPLNLLSLTPQLQQNYLKSLTVDNIRKYVQNSLKNLAEIKRIEGIGLASDNSFKNQKVNKFATSHGLKNDLLLMKKDFLDKIETPLKELNKKDENIMKLSNDLVMKVSAKLQGYKQALIQSISEKKMLDDVKRELDNIESQIKDFLKPLFNSHQTRSNLSFLDPDQFCIKIAEDILRSMTYLDNKMDELLACESDISQQSLDTGDIIDQVVQYYENVVIALREFAEKYSRQKKDALARRRVGNADQTMKKIVEKANLQVRQQLKAYDLVKEIESILHKRIDKNDSRMAPQDY